MDDNTSNGIMGILVLIVILICIGYTSHQNKIAIPSSMIRKHPEIEVHMNVQDNIAFPDHGRRHYYVLVDSVLDLNKQFQIRGDSIYEILSELENHFYVNDSTNVVYRTYTNNSGNDRRDAKDDYILKDSKLTFNSILYSEHLNGIKTQKNKFSLQYPISKHAKRKCDRYFSNKNLHY